MHGTQFVPFLFAKGSETAARLAGQLGCAEVALDCGKGHLHRLPAIVHVQGIHVRVGLMLLLLLQLPQVLYLEIDPNYPYSYS